MTLKEKQKKIVDYIVQCDNMYKEIEWLVKNTVINDNDVIECYDYVFRDKDDNLIFKED